MAKRKTIADYDLQTAFAALRTRDQEAQQRKNVEAYAARRKQAEGRSYERKRAFTVGVPAAYNHVKNWLTKPGHSNSEYPLYESLAGVGDLISGAYSHVVQPAVGAVGAELQSLRNRFTDPDTPSGPLTQAVLSAAKNPRKTAADIGDLAVTLTPGIGSAKTFKDITDQAAELRAAGQTEAADMLSEMAVPMSLGVLATDGTGGLALKGLMRSGARGAERLAGKSAVDAFATSERVPYAGSGHLSGLLKDAAARERYSADPRASWTDPQGNDILYNAAAMKQRPTRSATGVYDPPSGTGVETNPATVGLPQTSWLEGDIPALDRQKLNAAEAIRAYTDAQGAGAWHVSGGDAPSGAAGTSLFVPHSGPASKETLMGIREAGAPHGLPDVVDTGEGITLSNFYPGPPEADALKTSLGGDLGEYLRSVSGEEPQQRHVASGYRSMFEGIEDPVTGQMRIPEPGSGEITKKLEDLLAEYPDAVHQLDTPDFRQRALSGAALDDEMAAQGLGVARPDIQHARRLMGKYGLSGLFDARKAGAAVPSLAALMGAYGLAQPSDGSGY